MPEQDQDQFIWEVEKTCPYKINYQRKGISREEGISRGGDHNVNEASTNPRICPIL